MAGAPHHFQLNMESLLSKVAEFKEKLFVYLDDILIMNNTVIECRNLTNKVIKLLEKNDRDIKTAKSKLIPVPMIDIYIFIHI